MATTTTTPAADGSVLFGFWYPAVPITTLRKGALHKTMLLGIPLVVGRNERSQVFAMRDACPHRGIPLSYGHIVNGCNIECAYHGWQFDAVSGQCKLIPSLTARDKDKLEPERIFAGAYPARELDGFLWIYLPPPGTGRLSPDQIGALPSPPEIPKHSAKFKTAHLTANLPCNVDHGIIGLMDPAHGPFVHQSWWWRSQRSIHEKEKLFEPIPLGFRMSAHAPSANSAPYKLLGVYGEPVTTVIDFMLPNVRIEQIGCGKYWFSSITTVTPTTPGNTRIDVNAAWNIFRHVPFVKPIAKFFGARFVRQDQQTMIQQAEGLRFNPSLMLIDDADKPAKWYFALKRAYLEAQRTGREFVHPMRGPETLRWRS